MSDSPERLAVETRGLTRLFDGKPAVSALDLRVPVGAFYGFLGPTGADKSTTMKMLTGLLRPSGGEARVLGADLSREAAAESEKAALERREAGVAALLEVLDAQSQLASAENEEIQVRAAAWTASCPRVRRPISSPSSSPTLSLRQSRQSSPRSSMIPWCR